MRRLAIKLLVFLLLGAIVNVAVAWGCALFSPLRSVADRIADASASEGIWWKNTFANNSNAYPAAVLRHSSVGLDSITMLGNGKSKGFRDSRFEKVWRVAGGWPSRGLSGERFEQDVTLDAILAPTCALNSGTHAWAVSVDYSKRFRPGAYRILPLRPLWPGFAINTIFYAAVLWVIFAIPGTVKRLRRRAKGCCIHCGYDLRGQSGSSGEQRCPECGKAVPGRNAVHGAAAPCNPRNESNA
jgi:hypothetical protein